MSIIIYVKYIFLKYKCPFYITNKLFLNSMKMFLETLNKWR